MSNEGPEDAARERFLTACGSEAEARAFLAPVIAEWKKRVEALRERWTALQASLEIPTYERPPRSFSFIERTEDLAGMEAALDAEVISLDIFDTCLIRTLDDPKTVFLLLGAFVKRDGGIKAEEFARMRVLAENELRREGLEDGTREDTTLDAVYQKLGEGLGWDPETREAYFSKELELEKLFLRGVDPVNRFARQVIESGKILVYTSEMYLPGVVLQEWLMEKGFPAAPVYTSGEYGLSKGSGNLYRKLQQDYPEKIICHLGDHPVSDGSVPADLGLSTTLLRTAKRIYPDTFSDILHAAGKDRGPGPDSSFWERFGWEVAGPVHLAFAVHLHRESVRNRCRHIYFLSRDGWFPRKVFRKLQEAWGVVAEDHYLYASREFLGLGAMSEIGEREWDFLLKASPLLTGIDVLKRIGIPEDQAVEACRAAGIESPATPICHHWGYHNSVDRDRLYHAICRKMSQFLKYRETYQDSLWGYLESTALFKEPAMVVDLGWGGSSARMIGKLAEKESTTPLFQYFALFEECPNASTFFAGPENPERIQLLKGSITLMEFLFGSPEPTVRYMDLKGNDFNPVFRKRWSAEECYAWQEMEKGIESFTTSALRLMAHAPEGDGSAILEELLGRWLFEPTASELSAFAAITHGEGWGTEHRLRVSPDPGIPLHSSHLHEALCYAPWKPGLLKLAVVE